MSRSFGFLLLVALALPTRAAEVQSIAIAPSDALVETGTIQRFVATGTFTDATTAALSNATLAAGGNHTCVVRFDGTVRCWGQNGSGQLGAASGAAMSAVPLAVNGVTTATSVSSGWEHSCALLANGTVRCWGRGLEGQLGNAGSSNSSTPVNVTGIAGAVAVGAGFQHSCALLDTGAVRCWGANGDGRLGNASTSPSTTPVPVSNITDAVAIAVGGNISCALLAGGGVRCWGANNLGQLGNGVAGNSSVPVVVSGITTAVSITAGFDYACALLAGGAAKCWGRGIDGQLGNSGLSNSPLPVDVDLVGSAVALAAGLGHACAVMEGGTLQCWGTNGNGQLGNGTVVGVFPTPAIVHEIGNAIAVTGGFSHTCAVLETGAVRCWGINYEGQLGMGGTFDRTGNAVAVNGTAAGIEAGGNHSCAIGPSGTITCWGQNTYGQLGQGDGSAVPPVVVEGIDSAVDIALGDDHSCAVLANGTGRCWGRNNNGQLGINDVVPAATATPTSLPLLGNAIRIAAGGTHTCAVIQGGTVQCWGRNNVGQLAYVNGTGVIVTFPSTVQVLANVVDITAGFEHTCALLASGSVSCWGLNLEGQLGNASNSNTNAPVAVSGITNATHISAGAYHTCARLATSQIRCWGRNDEGQLGNGLTADSNVPVDTINDANATNVTAGAYHNCMTAGGFVRCWGTGLLGEIGSGLFQSRPDAQTVAVIANTAAAVDAGRSHNCVRLFDGTVRCWGYNGFGQLGDGGFGNAASPVVTRGVSMEAVALAWTAGDPDVVRPAMSGHVLAATDGDTWVTARYGVASRFATIASGPDTDGDGVPDPGDNCTLVPNADQRDTNGDGYGNVCDGDLDDSGGLVNVADLALFRVAFGSGDADADFNGSGSVNAADLALFRLMFGKDPGPAGVLQQ